jgi:hypothetical protein
VVPAALKVEIEGFLFKASPYKVSETLSEKQIKRKKKGWGHGSNGKELV